MNVPVQIWPNNDQRDDTQLSPANITEVAPADRPRTADAVRKLTAEECLALLRTHYIGRVAWQAADGPRIMPVSYRLTASGIQIQTAIGTRVAQLRRGYEVAFEVDHVNSQTRSGWSVIARGRSGPGADQLDDDHRVLPWSNTPAVIAIMVAVSTITGRSFTP